jgi:hypothetical protein
MLSLAVLCLSTGCVVMRMLPCGAGLGELPRPQEDSVAARRPNARKQVRVAVFPADPCTAAPCLGMAGGAPTQRSPHW